MARSPANLAAILGLAGGATGVLNWLLYATDAFWPQHSLGLVFGLAIALCLVRFYRMAIAPALFVLAAFTLSWVLAFRLALELADHIDSAPLVGLIAGALGGAIVGAGGALATGTGRRTLVLPALAGGVFGLALAAPHPLYLFVPWQIAVGASLGWVIARPNAGDRR